MTINLNTNVFSINRNNKSAFGKDKMVYVCSHLASGGEQEMKEKGIDIKTHIKNNMNNAIHHASKVWKNGDFPLWVHSTWPHFTNDKDPAERKQIIKGCLEVVKKCDALCSFGKPIGGMIDEINLAKKHGIPVLTEKELPQIDAIVAKAKAKKLNTSA